MTSVSEYLPLHRQSFFRRWWGFAEIELGLDGTDTALNRLDMNAYVNLLHVGLLESALKALIGHVAGAYASGTS